MSPRHIARTALVSSIVWLMASSPVLPQARQEPPTFGAEVALVTVPVFVTDKSGKAVPGLTVADFELEEQGKKTPVVAFLPVDAMQPAVVPDEVQREAGRRVVPDHRQVLGGSGDGRPEGQNGWGRQLHDPKRNGGSKISE